MGQRLHRHDLHWTSPRSLHLPCLNPSKSVYMRVMDRGSPVRFKLRNIFRSVRGCLADAETWCGETNPESITALAGEGLLRDCKRSRPGFYSGPVKPHSQSCDATGTWQIVVSHHVITTTPAQELFKKKIHPLTHSSQPGFSANSSGLADPSSVPLDHLAHPAWQPNVQ